MKFVYHKIDKLPRLSWCAIIKKQNRIIDVFHGPWVETKSKFFVEGAWDGTFKEGNFDRSFLMGSGGKINGNKTIFCTPYHIHEKLFSLKINNQLFVSPSLTFLLAITGKNLDINYIPYQVDLLNMVRNMSNHIGSIPIEGKMEITVYHFRNIEVNSDLSISILNKANTPDFKKFEDYRDFLIEKLRLLAENANSIDRKIQYTPISTISSGYDSSACSALATYIGCKDAVTFKTARAEKGLKDRIDSGKQIGQKLGLNVKEYDLLDYLNSAGIPEAEFVACGDLGQDFNLCSFEEAWSQKMVIIGNHGDHIWDRKYKNPQKDIFRRGSGGCCWSEFKFRVGWIYVPLPYIGCLSHPSIYNISNSKEMEPWCMWNEYDRPISRRIVEEKGVGRNLFGKEKKAISVLLNTDKRLRSQMNLNSLKSFEEFHRANKHKRNQLKQALWNCIFILYRIYSMLFQRLNYFFKKRDISFQIPCPIPDKFSQCPSSPSFLVHWGISLIKDRYKINDEHNLL